MPYSRRTYRRRRPPMRMRRRAPRALATVPRMMPRSYAFRRHNQVATKVFWFKINGQINSDIAGNNTAIFRTRGLADGNVVPQGRDEIFTLYDQFKVLAMRIRWFPADVGTEPGQVINQTVLFRGDQVVWSDQRVDPGLQVPLTIDQVINNASARMINPRRPYTRVIYRPRGVPTWGSCVNPNAQPDSWSGAIYQIINNSTPSNESGRPLWYYTLTWKVVVRGRRQN